MARLKDVLSAKHVKDALFDVELQFGVPEGFWEPDPELPYEHPEQRLFWKGAAPKRFREFWRQDWLEDFHMALRNRGWPTENIDALYSYFEDAVRNPDEGEELGPDVPPAMEFRVSFPGDWLVNHPEFFSDLEKLQKKGVSVPVKGKKKFFKLYGYRIYATGGELEGALWEDAIFSVKPPREKPKAYEGGPRDWFPEEPIVS